MPVYFQLFINGSKSTGCEAAPFGLPNLRVIVYFVFFFPEKNSWQATVFCQFRQGGADPKKATGSLGRKRFPRSGRGLLFHILPCRE